MNDSAPPVATPHFDSRTQEVFLNLWRTYDCLKALEERLFAEFDLSAQQYNALRLLRSVYPQPLQTSQLGRRLISRSPDMTRLLDRLETRELLRRVRSETSRRVVNVSITPQGLALLESMAAAVRQMHQEQLGHLSETDLCQLTQLLQRARAPHDDDTCSWLTHASAANPAAGASATE